METDEALEKADRLLADLLGEIPGGSLAFLDGFDLGQTKAGQTMLQLGRDEQASVVASVLERLGILDTGRGDVETAGGPPWLLMTVLQGLLHRKLPMTEVRLLALLDLAAGRGDEGPDPEILAWVVSALEDRAKAEKFSESLVEMIQRVTKDIRHDREYRKFAARLSALIGDDPFVVIMPGEAWSEAALEDLGTLPAGERRCWNDLLAHCQSASAGKPSAAWRKKAELKIKAVGFAAFKSRMLRWFPLVDRPKSPPHGDPRSFANDDLIDPRHADLLRGLAACAGFEPDVDLARALTALTLSAYRKVPEVGPRLVTLGNAAVSALGAMPGRDAIAQLAYLKVKIKFIPAQKMVEKALAAAADREGLPREEIDELAVPAYGMEEVGRRHEVLGDYAVDLIVDGQDAALHWSQAASRKAMKSVPTAVKKGHAEELKELQSTVKDVGKMLTAQRERIDGMFLAKKSWSLATWRERYLDHPLVGTIARRLLWHFDTGGRSSDGLWLDGQFVGVDDGPLDGLVSETTVTLWHPIGRPVAEIKAWRDWLDRHQIRQPFKQAHREVYVLTEAERNTDVYSNRFAAHILRQHQYHALCASRGWRKRLRLMVDDTYPPTSKDLPEWGLRAEFWVEGIGDDYGRDTTASGSYLHLSTDQVRFYEIGAAQRLAHASGGGYSAPWNQVAAEPVSLDRVPPLVLSEILRDVDLFVGVASVGNDPTWSDGGPQGRYRDYWQNYSFGHLSATAQTRKAVLERLIPRLKIAPRCTFSDKFLIVRGDLRTYKIHLGSGNILMEPNDQYLCIVAKREENESASESGVFLPFQGDNTLSNILSKAILLADDAKINDPTIVSQIQGR